MNTDSKEYLKYLTYYPVAIVILSSVSFCLGNLCASIYYGRFGIDYFKYADFQTGYLFLLQNLDSALIFFIFTATVLMIGYSANKMFITFISKIEGNKEDILNLTKQRTQEGEKLIFLMKSLVIKEYNNFKNSKLLIPLVLILATPISVGYLTTNLTDNLIKNNVKKRLYRPVNVRYGAKNDLICVYPVGKIGEFTAFVNEEIQPILIKTSSIESVIRILDRVETTHTDIEAKKLAAVEQPPKRFMNEHDKKIWYKAWDSLCKSDISYKLIDFNKLRNDD
ncbi:hypothetical protein HR45_02620 [Shewanella mangrovi]|uniref:Uncharacterized protein n=1 Tax=Shewanella mangrovi TaxID=1515746 RepID=A0A094JJZ6_9GAMM|nr:hypothetical protein [Shewanella mangrovi]KFZ38359.1 hypothetical protein HR45_02620 [Shewanella mangrovi]